LGKRLTSKHRPNGLDHVRAAHAVELVRELVDGLISGQSARLALARSLGRFGGTSSRIFPLSGLNRTSWSSHINSSITERAPLKSTFATRASMVYLFGLVLTISTKVWRLAFFVSSTMASTGGLAEGVCTTSPCGGSAPCGGSVTRRTYPRSFLLYSTIAFV